MFGLILGIFGSISSSFCLIFRKKAIDETKSSWITILFSRLLCSVFLGLIFLATGLVKLEIFLNINAIFFAVMSGFFNTIKGPLEKKIYKEEHLSVLAPYENFSDILIIFFSFLYFRDTSIISFLIAVLAVFIVILSSIDFKNFTFPKNFKNIIISKFFVAGWIIMNGLALQIVNPFEFFVLANTVMFFMVLVLSLFTKSLGSLKINSKYFYMNMWASALFGELAEFLGYIVIDGFGLVLSTLLSFLSIIVTLSLSFFIFKDKPEKKDLIVAIITMILVGLGFYFK